MYPFDIFYYIIYKLDICIFHFIFCLVFSVIISLSQWFVQRNIQVTSYDGMLLVSYFVL